MTTNAQAALQAAATVFSTGRGHTAPADVKGMATSFLNWLDHQDQDKAATVVVVDLPPQEGQTTKRLKLATWWELYMWPRNTRSDAFRVVVSATSADEATSKALGVKPGHAWANLKDTGVPFNMPQPGPTVYP